MGDPANQTAAPLGPAPAPAPEALADPTVAQPALALRAAWESASPSRRDYGDVVAELSSLKLVGEGSVFERGPHVPVTHMGFFKPPADAFISDLRSRDRRSAKEWEYINSAGVRMELGLTALGVAKTQSDNVPSMARKLALAERALKAALEVLSMRAQYFREITEQGVEAARQMSFLVEQGHDAVFSESYRSARQALTSKLEIEAAKMLAKARLAKATGGKSTGTGSTTGGPSEE